MSCEIATGQSNIDAGSCHGINLIEYITEDQLACGVQIRNRLIIRIDDLHLFIDLKASYSAHDARCNLCSIERAFLDWLQSC